jgi:hypothetical protein
VDLGAAAGGLGADEVQLVLGPEGQDDPGHVVQADIGDPRPAGLLQEAKELLRGLLGEADPPLAGAPSCAARVRLPGHRYGGRHTISQEARMGELFDRRLRTDESRREDNEGAFVFLGRSARPSSGEVRRLLEEWLSRVPEGPDKNQLRGALASRKDDETFESGFWELYLHEAYRRSGYTVTIHPDLPGERTHPDFLVEGSSSRFYLEAVRVGTSPEHRGQAQRLADIRTKLRAQRAQQFILSVTCHAIGPRALKAGELIAFLDQWLTSLSHEPGAWTGDAELPRQRRPRTRWPGVPSANGWSFEFEAIPLPPAVRETGLPLVGAFTGCVADTSSISRPLRRALETKAAKYGRDLPLVIAVLSNTALGTGDDDVGRALFGTHPNTPLPASRSEPGLWRQGDSWRHDHVIQVIAAQDLYPWSITRQQPRVWTNPRPRASLAVPAQPGWLRRIQVSEGHPAVADVLSAAVPPTQFFDLPHDWPG